MPSGLVFNIQKYSLHDGPGIRTTVFLKGCPLCCAWCHNSESISPRRELIVLEGRCTACGECRPACPFAGEIPGEGVLPARNEPCTLCESCVTACPTGARQMVGRSMTVAEVMDEVLQDRVFYEDSGGGVTFSGGEPLMQPAFVRALLEASRAHGLHTAIDTCGFGSPEHLLAWAPLTHLFLYDLKFMDDAQHREFCGASNGPILANLRRLAEVHDGIWLRVPVIPGVNDSDANLAAIARFAVSLRGIRQVSLLPYHPTGVQKFARLGRDHRFPPTAPPSAERMQQATALFRSCGLDVRIGG